MSVTLSLFAGVGAQFLDNNGVILSGGLIYTYTAGTTTPLTTYTTNLGTVAQPNPIVLDSAGRIPGGELWLTTGYGYKFVTKDSNGVLIGTYDNVPSSAQPPITNDASSIAYEQGNSALAGSFIIGNSYLITYIGTTNFELIGATSNTVGLHFIATGVGSGTGTAQFSRTVQSKLQESVSAFDFGATGDGTTDDTVALQTAINYCIDNGNKLFIPKGVYIISSPLLLAKWNGSSFSFFGIDIEGERYVGTDGTKGKYTVIKPTFNNTFAIGIQLGRGIRIKDLSIVGLNNFAPIVDSNKSLYMVDETYVTAGCRDSQYSPYAGIAVDPFSPSVPSDGGYPGLTSYYVSSAYQSSGIEFSGLQITCFVCGIVISPSGNLVGSSEITFFDVAVNTAKCGLSVTDTQSRNLQWFGGAIGQCLYGFDGFNYGIQKGYSPGITGCNMGYCKYLFNIFCSGGNSQSIRNIHAETFASLGFFGFGSASSREPINITGCEFNFYSFDSNLFPDHNLVTVTPLNFISCYIENQQNVPFRILSSYLCPVVFDTCTINFVSSIYNDFLLLNSSNYVFRNCYTPEYNRGSSDGGSNLSNINTPSEYSLFDKSYIPLGATLKYISQGNSTDFQFCGGFNNNVSLGNLVLTIISTGIGQITVPDGSIINVGDLIVNSSTSPLYENVNGALSLVDNACAIGVASSVSGNLVTVQGLPQNLVAGTYPLYSAWYSRYHEPSTGDISTSTTIANVTNITTWLIGHHIKGAGIVTGTYITNVNSVTNTLTLSKATTATTTGIRLYDADMQLVTGTPI